MQATVERNRATTEPAIKGWRPRALARAIGVSHGTVYEAIASGELRPVWRFGRSIIVPQASVDRWLESKSTDTPTNRD